MGIVEHNGIWTYAKLISPHEPPHKNPFFPSTSQNPPLSEIDLSSFSTHQVSTSSISDVLSVISSLQALSMEIFDKLDHAVSSLSSEVKAMKETQSSAIEPVSLPTSSSLQAPIEASI
ncbi:hypothetical protein U1Q18_032938, partial [Sarracenia purpurea var. burkii]